MCSMSVRGPDVKDLKYMRASMVKHPIPDSFVSGDGGKSDSELYYLIPWSFSSKARFCACLIARASRSPSQGPANSTSQRLYSGLVSGRDQHSGRAGELQIAQFGLNSMWFYTARLDRTVVVFGRVTTPKLATS